MLSVFPCTFWSYTVRVQFTCWNLLLEHRPCFEFCSWWFPWRRPWHPTPVFLPGESQGRGSLMGAVYGVAQSRTRLKQFSSSYEITCGQVFFPAPQALWVFRGHQHWLWSCCYGKWPAAAFFPAQLWLLRQSKPVRKPFWIVTQRRTFQKKHLPSYLLSPGRIPGPSTLFCGRWCNS